MRRLGLAFLIGLAGCTAEQRSGPLAGLADSLFPPGTQVRCRTVSKPLPRQPAHEVCGLAADPSAFFYVGEGGRILGVVRNLPTDSTSASYLARQRQGLVRHLGEPVYEGDDTHGNTVHYWRSDSLCASLYEVVRPALTQLSYHTPDYFGEQCST